MLKTLKIIGNKEDFSFDPKNMKFGPNDSRLIENNNYIEKLKNTIYDFNVILGSNGPNIDNEFNIKLLNLLPDDNSINVILDRNRAPKSTFVPLTPWMFIHRIVHVIETNYYNDGKPVDQTKDERLLFLNKILNILYGNEKYKNYSNYSDIKRTLTMKSARNNKLRNQDIITELATQYIFNGKITLKKESFVGKNSFTQLFLFTKLENYNVSISNIKLAEIEINNFVKNLLDYSLGKKLCWNRNL